LREGSERTTFYIEKMCPDGFRSSALGISRKKTTQVLHDERDAENGKIYSISERAQND
jgi:hypothetical protein